MQNNPKKTFICSKSTIWMARKRCETCSTISIKTPKQHWYCFRVFIIKFEHIPQLFLQFFNFFWAGIYLLGFAYIISSESVITPMEWLLGRSHDKGFPNKVMLCYAIAALVHFVSMSVFILMLSSLLQQFLEKTNKHWSILDMNWVKEILEISLLDHFWLVFPII